MPTKKYKKRTYKKKPKKTVFRPQRLITTGFPKTTCVKLRYCDTVTINPGLGTVGYHSFRANSCFDPDYTGTGHQPLGFDQWSTFYNHYIVVGAKIKITVTSNSGPGSGMLVSGIALTDEVATISNFTDLMEQGLTRVQKQSVHMNAQRPRATTKCYSAKKFFNVINVLDNWTRIGAKINANPVEMAYFNVWATNSTAVDQTNVDIIIELEQIVVFSEPKELSQS
ncbi:hypothetical protein [Shewanella sp.]|uniref:hypothetical protein n=1 Tax=Shewanella sp. TaxID=50422 RepID=UPI004048DFD0